MEKNTRWLMIWPILWLAIGVEWSTSVIEISNNGYKNLVVSIHKDIPENPQIVANIKEMLTKASIHLYKVTKNRSFFEDVTIVVPSSWSSNSEYQPIKGGDRFAKAEVRVDKANPTYGDTPYTLQPGQCGERGEYIHLTPDFLLGNVNGPPSDNLLDHWPYGEPGKVFVHEWAHLRYGVFDEHGDPKDKLQREFYLDAYNNIRPTGCSEGVRGWLRDTAGNPCVLDVDGLPNSKCVFYPLIDEREEGQKRTSKKPSIMYLPSMDSADGFCEDDNKDLREHNFYAPNKHNRMCRGRSTWSVISNNPDFKNNLNPPRQIPEANLNPKFRVIQPKKNQKPIYVLVLDVSGSMQGRRIELQKAATSRFIKLQLVDSSLVGMVSFSSDAKVLSSMTTLNDKTRADLLNRIPTVADGSTAIGKGIQAGLKLITDSGEPTEDAMMLLVSDGEENVTPYIENILPDIVKSKIIINTVAFGKQATTKFEKLVTLTGGRAFFYDDDKVSHKLLDAAFVESATTHVDVDLAPIDLVNRDISIKPSTNFKGNFFVDKASSQNTVFLITYDTKLTADEYEQMELVLYSPDKKTFDSKSPEYSSDRSTLSIRIKIPQATPGKWEYTINNRLAKPMVLTLLITGETSNVKEQPVRVRSWVSDLDIKSPSRVKIYAEVKKGYNAVVNASVIGTVGRPQGQVWIMMLFDNGAGADVAEGDGIYSAYFSNFNGAGRYSVEAIVMNDGQAKIKTAGLQNSRAPRVNRLDRTAIKEEPQQSFDPAQMKVEKSEDASPNSDDNLEAVENFERYAPGGAFRLDTFTAVTDVIPPSQVTDLKVVHVDSDKRTVHLKWTSPNDDNIEEVITEVIYAQDLRHFNLNFDQTIKISEVQQSNETVIELPMDLQLNESNYRVYFCLRSRDKAGNVGEISNSATAVFQDPSIYDRISPVDNYREPEENPLKTYFMWIVVGVIAGVVLLLFIIAFITYKILARRHYEQVGRP